MANARKELYKERVQAGTDLEKTPEYNQLLEACQKKEALRKKLSETPQQKRVDLLDWVDSEAISIRDRWTSRLGYPLGLAAAVPTFSKLFLDACYAPFSEFYPRFIVSLAATFSLLLLGFYTGNRFGNARAEKFIGKELQKSI